MSLTKLSLVGNILARESLVSDIPVGGGKIDNHFLQCSLLGLLEVFLNERSEKCFKNTRKF
jgi:hypothetical protein